MNEIVIETTLISGNRDQLVQTIPELLRCFETTRVYMYIFRNDSGIE